MAPRSGNRVMSPTSTSNRAAPDGPLPWRSSNDVPVAATSSRSSLSAAFFRTWIRSRSATSSAATRRLVLPAMSRGRTPASSAFAWAADRSFFAPPGTARVADGAAERSPECGPHPAIGAGRPGPATRPTARRRLPDADRPSESRPARPSARRWRRSCGLDRSRTPAPAPTASAARRPPARRLKAAVPRRGGRFRCSPRPPRPGPRGLAGSG